MSYEASCAYGSPVWAASPGVAYLRTQSKTTSVASRSRSRRSLWPDARDGSRPADLRATKRPLQSRPHNATKSSERISDFTGDRTVTKGHVLRSGRPTIAGHPAARLQDYI